MPRGRVKGSKNKVQRATRGSKLAKQAHPSLDAEVLPGTMNTVLTRLATLTNKISVLESNFRELSVTQLDLQANCLRELARLNDIVQGKVEAQAGNCCNSTEECASKEGTAAEDLDVQ